MTVRRAHAAVVGAGISSRRPLPPGVYRCELRVGGALIAVVRVRLG